MYTQELSSHQYSPNHRSPSRFSCYVSLIILMVRILHFQYRHRCIRISSVQYLSCRCRYRSEIIIYTGNFLKKRRGFWRNSEFVSRMAESSKRKFKGAIDSMGVRHWCRRFSFSCVLVQFQCHVILNNLVRTSISWIHIACEGRSAKDAMPECSYILTLRGNA